MLLGLGPLPCLIELLEHFELQLVLRLILFDLGLLLGSVEQIIDSDFRSMKLFVPALVVFVFVLVVSVFVLVAFGLHLEKLNFVVETFLLFAQMVFDY